MTNVVEYYFSPISGYAYLGHQAFLDMATKGKMEIAYYPINIVKVFAASGTIPPARQSDVRKSYRIEDMKRYADLYQVPLNSKPKFWPTDGALACKAVVASRHLGLNQGIATNAIMKGVWALDADIAHAESLIKLLDSAGMPGAEILHHCTEKAVIDECEHFTDSAVDKGIFGSPTYVLHNERYWGQDRLSMLQQQIEKLNSKR